MFARRARTYSSYAIVMIHLLNFTIVHKDFNFTTITCIVKLCLKYNSPASSAGPLND